MASRWITLKLNIVTKAIINLNVLKVTVIA